MPDKAFLTVRDVARQLREPTHRVVYALREYRIDPAQRAGIIRLFTPDQLATIAAAVKRVRERKGAPIR